VDRYRVWLGKASDLALGELWSVLVLAHSEQDAIGRVMAQCKDSEYVSYAECVESVQSNSQGKIEYRDGRLVRA